MTSLAPCCRSRPAVIAMVVWLVLSPQVRGEAGGGSIVGEARLPSGITARFVNHYDRNALRRSERIGESLVALTEAGTLLRFDLKTLHLTHEQVAPLGFRCLSRGAGNALLVGGGDGRISRVDPATLALTELEKLPGRADWVGQTERGELVAISVAERDVKDDGKTWTEQFSIVYDLARHRTYEPTIDDAVGRRVASTVLLDRKRRLWFGADNGEWGGWCARLDLESGVRQELLGPRDGKGRSGPSWDGVYGFIELRDGQVWAFGGMAHMGMSSAFVCRVDRGNAEVLFTADNNARVRAAVKGVRSRRPTWPTAPINHVIEDESGELIVFCFSDVYRPDARFQSWKKVHKLDVRYREGRPKAVASEPAVLAVHRLAPRGDDFVCATTLDGFVRVIGGKETHHILPGQLEAGDFGRIASSREGLLCIRNEDQEGAWQFRAGSWRIADLAPPFERHPEEPSVEFEPQAWDKSNLLIGPGGEVYSVNASAVSPGTRTTARRHKGKIEVLGREYSRLCPQGAFITPDGRLWSAWLGVLSAFVDGRWEAVGTFPEKLVELEDVGADGPPRILRDRRNEHLYRLFVSTDKNAPRLERLDVIEKGSPLKVRDALTWERGVLLLATDRGLRTYDIGSGKLSLAPLPDPGRTVGVLKRDRLGRLWLGGTGLAMIEANGRTVHSFDNLPAIGRAEIAAIAVDDEHDAGIVVALRGRGVVSVWTVKETR